MYINNYSLFVDFLLANIALQLCLANAILQLTFIKKKKKQTPDWKYCVIQCTGYLKSWAPAKIGLEEQETEADEEACNLSCLVAVGRIQPPLVAPTSTPRRLRSIEFVSRHANDGKFLFVDQR